MEWQNSVVTAPTRLYRCGMFSSTPDGPSLLDGIALVGIMAFALGVGSSARFLEESVPRLADLFWDQRDLSRS
jgi:hypothetical protein